MKVLLKTGDDIDGSSSVGGSGRGAVRESKRKRSVAKDATAGGDDDSDNNNSSDSEDSYVVNEKESAPMTNKKSKLKSDPTITRTWKGRRKLKTLGECKRLDSEDSIIITWEHVLHAIQTHSKELEAKKETKLLVHNDLPELKLTPGVVYRTQQRLLKLYRNI